MAHPRSPTYGSSLPPPPGHSVLANNVKLNEKSGLPGADLGGFPGFQKPPSKSHKLNSLTLIGLLISHPASNNPNL